LDSAEFVLSREWQNERKLCPKCLFCTTQFTDCVDSFIDQFTIKVTHRQRLFRYRIRPIESTHRLKDPLHFRCAEVLASDVLAKVLDVNLTALDQLRHQNREEHQPLLEDIADIAGWRGEEAQELVKEARVSEDGREIHNDKKMAD
jgi:hypothetical protein